MGGEGAKFDFRKSSHLQPSCNSCIHIAQPPRNGGQAAYRMQGGRHTNTWCSQRDQAAPTLKQWFLSENFSRLVQIGRQWWLNDMLLKDNFAPRLTARSKGPPRVLLCNYNMIRNCLILLVYLSRIRFLMPAGLSRLLPAPGVSIEAWQNKFASL